MDRLPEHDPTRRFLFGVPRGAAGGKGEAESPCTLGERMGRPGKEFQVSIIRENRWRFFFFHLCSLGESKIFRWHPHHCFGDPGGCHGR